VSHDLNLRLSEILPATAIAVDERTRRAKSSDYHWFSPVLAAELDGACADICAFPATEADLIATLAAAHEAGVPVTVRGGGTGNFGQCVPLLGGLVISTERLNAVLEIADGRARVEPGATFASIDRAAAGSGQELPIFPTTYRTATIGGFIAGGSAGVGSVTHGGVPDGNVHALDLCGLSAHPSPERVHGAALWPHLHDYGTAGVISAAEVALVPRRTWGQAIVSFDSLVPCHAFCLELLLDESIGKRMISALDAGVVAHYRRANPGFTEGRAAALLIYDEAARSAVEALALRHGGRPDRVFPPGSKVQLFEFAFNHSTLWAKKSDPSLTYMQASLVTERSEEQLRSVAIEYPEIAFHLEYLRWAGAPLVEMLPIFPYRGRDQLEAMIADFEGLGLAVGNPHTYVLEEGSSVEDIDGLLAAKKRYDPAGLLNPGKLAAATDGRRRVFRTAASMSLGHTT